MNSLLKPLTKSGHCPFAADPHSSQNKPSKKGKAALGGSGPHPQLPHTLLSPRHFFYSFCSMSRGPPEILTWLCRKTQDDKARTVPKYSDHCTHLQVRASPGWSELPPRAPYWEGSSCQNPRPEKARAYTQCVIRRGGNVLPLLCLHALSIVLCCWGHLFFFSWPLFS